MLSTIATLQEGCIASHSVIKCLVSPLCSLAVSLNSVFLSQLVTKCHQKLFSVFIDIIDFSYGLITEGFQLC